MGKTPIFQDPDFRPSEDAIQEIKYNGNIYRGRDIQRVVDWRRLKDLPAFQKATDGRPSIRLFEGKSSIFQRNATQRNAPKALRFRCIPVWRQQGAQPCFAQPSGNEAWVLLLEKAMAKYVGSYSLLDGGTTSWALETLTGHYTCVFLLEGKAYSSVSTAMPAVVYHLAIGNLVAAATVGTDDDTDVDGVVRAHAYTVMAAQPVSSDARGQLMMVQVRNPHGSGGLEWRGDWSDQSPLWSQHPEVVGGGSNGFDYVEDNTAGLVEVFYDPSFPHDHRSLGDYKFILNGEPKTGAQLNEIIKWLRLKDIAAPEQFRRGARGLKLFAGGGTHPDDIDGGSTGLMVAVACLANKPGAVEELFVSGREYRPDGAYQVRLYEPKTGTASIAPFDDCIPCYNNTPITKTKILGSEVWVLLLEKAVARLVESYSKVSMWGVQVCWALACLTGQYTCMFMWEDAKKKWRRLELQYVERQPGQYRAEYLSDEQSLMVSEDVFKTVSTQLVLGCLMAAESDKEDVGGEGTGLAKARSYSVLDARCGIRLGSLRANSRPWVATQSDLEAAARRLAEARRQQALRAEQEALEESQHEQLRKRAMERARGPTAGQVFAQAAITAAANAPARRQLAPPPPPSASTAAAGPAGGGGGGGAGGRPVVEVVPESKAGPCKSCSIM
ncbi:hypothetical protein VOLCADRAFT_105151 [Volvox carteri f. nagariensis]|uniref:Calpain catalytic domain-containing protein n=1 Tax=Volvox carteri f. nagariensis TaxID=3068 RepID=D8TYQ1_VOLCA|nr:uncharacterized protein VOLCADRAFT_105151 [Volvox carteri f. nagariensis]EFJ47433.1 hypothetical protein VOLCADRAFT_105151 [Volvox carteri f. nagariensis]|eukprot:XP_002951622.1 hypothetical protein VOLCADRAFT_105151 [Volvox carteri f. nagariensis]